MEKNEDTPAVFLPKTKANTNIPQKSRKGYQKAITYAVKKNVRKFYWQILFLSGLVPNFSFFVLSVI